MPAWHAGRNQSILPGLILAFALAVTVGMAVYRLIDLRSQARLQHSLQFRLSALQTTSAEALRDCASLRAAQPLVLLVLGQSNAANHGEPTLGGSPATWMMDAGICSISSDPLPGATGRGGTPWSLLPQRLAALGFDQPVLIQLLAVDASTVNDWVRPDSPLRSRLRQAVARNAESGLQPQLVLWQQGEADARAGTPPDQYRKGLLDLADQLHQQGLDAPIVLALSTVCSSPPDVGLRTSLLALPQTDPRFKVGPDTDQVQSRRDGCHWDAAGRQQVAQAWADKLYPLLAQLSQHRPL